MITDAIIDEGLKLDAERTPGEWIVGQCVREMHGPFCDEQCHNLYVSEKHTDICDPCSMISEHDARFIAFTANHLGDLLRELKRLRELCEPINDGRNSDE